MLVRSDRLESLASPAFIGALVLLVVNDLALKPLFHNALTGKLSDFAGLFALTLFFATLWPRHARLLAALVAAAFTFWKTIHAESLIESLNAVLPFSVGRTVDLTDLIALPMIPLAVWAAPRLKPWPLPRALQIGLAVLAPIAFTATSRFPYAARVTMDATRAAVVDPAAVQQVFDAVAERHGLRCEPCGPISVSRIYSGSEPLFWDGLRVILDEQANTLAFTMVGGYSRDERRVLRALAADISTEMAERFPGITVIDLAPGDLLYALPESTILVIHMPGDSEAEVIEQAERDLAAIVDDVARVNDLRSRSRGRAHYAGEKVDRRVHDLDLVFTSAFESQTTLVVRVELRTSGFEALQRALVEDLEARLNAAFGSENVTRHVPPDADR